MSTAALFLIIPNWKQPKYPSTDKWVSKLWNTLAMEYFSLIQRKQSVIM